ncbi:MAG: hypothetical protein Q9162_003271 [Coniocarpon cinnabarinum]
MKLSLKVNTSSSKPTSGQAFATTGAPSPLPASAPLKLNLGSATPSQPTPPPAASFSNAQAKSRKPSGKKRQREEDEHNTGTAHKKRQSSVIKFGGLNTANSVTPKTPGSAALPFFKLHTNKKTKPPSRPLGVGYDSEAEDAEDDPAVEENVIVRMAPGSDCDYLHDAISKGLVGRPVNAGGADVYIRFFKNRRAALVIRGNIYAAVLVDLPCIVESMKSWDKRGWWKSADICQMLLVTDKVPSEKEAETVVTPNEVDEKTSQYPHGLTPPMHHVRKRRFRKRVSHTTIEQAEDRVEELMATDDNVRSNGGQVEAWTVDLDQAQSQELSSAAEDEDAEGEPDETMQPGDYPAEEVYEQVEEDDDEDPEAVAARVAQEMMGDDADVAGGGLPHAPVSSGDTVPELHQAQATIDESGASITNGIEAESEEDDDDDDDDIEEGNEADQEQARLKAQQREEIADLQRDIEKATNDLSQASNPIIKQRFEKRLASLREEFASKKRSLGEDPDDD